MLTSLKSCRSPCTWHCHHAAERERDAKSLSLQFRDVAIQFARFESGRLQNLGYPSRDGLPFADPWREGVERSLLSEWKLLDHTIIIAAAIAQWCSRLNACVCMNGGHFEHKFEPLTSCCVLFVSSILVPLNVIDINMCKVLILCKMCYFCVWDFHMVQ